MIYNITLFLHQTKIKKALLSGKHEIVLSRANTLNVTLKVVNSLATIL